MLTKPTTTLLIVTLTCTLALAGGVCHAKRSGDPEEIQAHIATLNKAIQDGNEPMRNKMFMEFRLIEQDNKGAVAPVLLKNLESSIPGVSEYTAFILGWIDDPRAVPELRKLLAGTDSQKRAACQALGNMECQEAKQALDDMAALLADPNPRVRQDAAYGLGIMGDPRAKPHLEKAVQDEDELVRFMAKEAIERIDNRQKYGW